MASKYLSLHVHMYVFFYQNRLYVSCRNVAHLARSNPRGGQLIVLTSANMDNSSSNSSIFVSGEVMSRQHGVCAILLC